VKIGEIAENKINLILERLGEMGLMRGFDGRELSPQHYGFDGMRFQKMMWDKELSKKYGVKKVTRRLNLSPNEIYIWWNGLDVGKYAQSSVYLYSPLQWIGMDIPDTSENYAVIFECTMYHQSLWVNQAVLPRVVNWEWVSIEPQPGPFMAQYMGNDYEGQYNLFSIPLDEPLPTAKALNYSLSGWTTEGNIHK